MIILQDPARSTKPHRKRSMLRPFAYPDLARCATSTTFAGSATGHHHRPGRSAPCGSRGFRWLPAAGPAASRILRSPRVKTHPMDSPVFGLSASFVAA